MNYKTYFKNISGDKYIVRILQDKTNLEYQDFTLAGDEPVMIEYEPQEDLFSPLRPSVCTIKMLTEGYPLDLYTSKLDTYVYIEKPAGVFGKPDEVVWAGFLQPNIYSQGYSEPIEKLEIVAWDFISALDYRKYQPVNEKPGIVSVFDIIKRICEISVNSDGFKVVSNKRSENGYGFAALKDFYISESNFYSSEDEPWNYRDVLEAICRYFSFTAVQIEDTLWLIDPLAFKDDNTALAIKYPRSNGYEPDGYETVGGLKSINSSDYRLTGGTMGLDSIINHVVVQDNYYNVDNVLPDIMDEDDLENVMGPWTTYKTAEFGNPDTMPDAMPFIGTTSKVYYRLFRNKKWQQFWYNLNGQPVVPPLEDIQHFRSQKNYIGATICDTGTMENVGNPKQSDLSLKRYLCLAKHNYPLDLTATKFPKLISANNIKPIIVGSESYLVISTNVAVTFFKNAPAFSSVMGTEIKDVEKRYNVKIDPLQNWKLNFSLRIGNKWWSGANWVDAFDTFGVFVKDMDPKNYFQTDTGVVDFTDQTLFLGLKGYCIDLPGDLTELNDVEFSIHSPSMWLTADKYTSTGGEPVGNEYVWMSDIRMEIRKKNQALFRDEDAVVENIIADNTEAIADNEKTIQFKLTTEGDNFSYSSVAYKTTTGEIKALKGVNEPKIGSEYNTQEENTVQQYIEQYKTPTIQETVTLSRDYSPLDIINDTYWPGKKYYTIGQTIDLAMDRQTVTLIELKK